MVGGALLLSVIAGSWAGVVAGAGSDNGQDGAEASVVASVATAGDERSGDSGPMAEQRRQFTEALDALASGNQPRFASLKAALSDYPLADYLDYEQLQHQWRDVTPGSREIQQLNAFEQRSGDSSLTRRLTRTLQKRFAETEQWKTFLALGKSRLAASMTCETLKARSEAGQVHGFDEQIVEMWVKPRAHREPCKSILDDIEARNTPPISAIWERIYQAMESDKPEFATPMIARW